MLVSWDGDHATGYDFVDDGQRLIIEAINRLNAATTPCQCDAVVDQMLTVLIQTLTRQFGHEDALLMRTPSPENDAHAAEHRNFLTTLNALKNTQGDDVPVMLLLSLIAFLAQHLRGTDRAVYTKRSLAA